MKIIYIVLLISALQQLGQAQDPFIFSIWNPSTTSAITIPTDPNEMYNYTVDWGDGIVTSGHIGDAVHAYTTIDTFQIKISGTFSRIKFSGLGSYITSVDQWGDQVWTSMASSFRFCNKMHILATDAPDLGMVNSMAYMLSACTVFNENINHWDVSNVSNMDGLFFGCQSFNLDLNSWNVSNVTTMKDMFKSCGVFDRNIGFWDVSSVTTMEGMFYRCSVFNQELNNWDLSSLIDMRAMFRDAKKFNSNISNWDVSNVLYMGDVFVDAHTFNQDISQWDVSNALSMFGMFGSCDSFNCDISSWDVSSVKNTQGMFALTKSFNQNISVWNTSSLTNCKNMFYKATDFDQNLGSWDISQIYTMDDMFFESKLSTENYDSTLIGWASQTPRSNVEFDAGNSTFCAGSTARTDLINNYFWDINDSGLDSTCTCVLPDTIPPFATCISFTLFLDSANMASITVAQIGDSTFDNCSLDSLSISQSNFDCSHIGQNFVDLIAIDGAGNRDTCTATITVLEMIYPSVTCPNDATVNTDPSFCYATNVALGQATAVDNCSLHPIINDASDTFSLGQDTIIWSVYDYSGNYSYCEQIITVVDNEPPTITCPGDITVQLDLGTCFASNVVLGAPTTSDNCSIASVTENAPNYFPKGETLIRWKAVDGSGNEAICFQSVTAIDTEKPTIICPLDITISTDIGSCSASNVVLGSPIISDNCIISSITNNATNTFQLGNRNVRWTVRDESGNTKICIQKVTVIDTELPTISCPPDITIQSDVGQCAASNVQLGTPGTVDNCHIQTIINNAPSSFNLSMTDVEWKVTDAAGNEAICTQLVTVVDNENPNITCPSNLIVSNDAGLCGASITNFGTPVMTDNCGVLNYSNDAPNIFPVGNTSLNWIVNDHAGNGSQCVQNIEVRDIELPNAVCQDITIELDQSGNAIIIPEQLNNNSTDNCGIVSMTASRTTFNCNNLGSQNVNFNVSDAAGNISTCQAVVTVIDNLDPVVVCKNFSTSLNEQKYATITPYQIFDGSPDNCGATTYSISQNYFTCTDIGPNSVTLVISNPSGFIDSCTAVVFIQDEFGYCCPNTLFIGNNPISDGTYHANHKIISNSMVPNNGDVIFNTGGAIELTSEFQVDAGGKFITDDAGCN